MRIIKIRKTDYNNMFRFYEKNNIKDVTTVYMSAEDVKLFRKGLKDLLKKENSWATKKYIDDAEKWNFFQYGPNECLEKALKPGYAIILAE